MNFGNNLKLAIYGESHGKSIGVIIDGLPPNVTLDFEKINQEMNRRRPGKNKMSTSRNELDQVEIQSGYFENRTTGAPLCGIIKNADKRSKDYSKIKDLLRPGHADLTGKVKYKEANDFRGGGQFSGRLTAPICFAGAIAKQLLAAHDIIIGSHIKKIKNCTDRDFDFTSQEKNNLLQLNNETLPVLDAEKADEMKNIILKARQEKTSVGGVVQTKIINVPIGVGDPIFNSYESNLAKGIFSIPGAKGIEFGLGFELSEMTGDQSNDAYRLEAGEITLETNNNGGILGGISNGMPIVFNVAFKPTPSIGTPQKTVNYKTMTEETIEVKGRHDPCFVPRALVVVEAIAALVTLDLLYEKDKNYGQ